MPAIVLLYISCAHRDHANVSVIVTIQILSAVANTQAEAEQGETN